MREIFRQLQDIYQDEKLEELKEVKSTLMQRLDQPPYQEEFHEFIQFIFFDLNKTDRNTLIRRFEQHKTRLSTAEVERTYRK